MENVLSALKVMKYLTESVSFLMITAQNTDTLMERISGMLNGSMVVKKSVKNVTKAIILITIMSVKPYQQTVRLLM